MLGACTWDGYLAIHPNLTPNFPNFHSKIHNGSNSIQEVWMMMMMIMMMSIQQPSSNLLPPPPPSPLNPNTKIRIFLRKKFLFLLHNHGLFFDRVSKLKPKLRPPYVSFTYVIKEIQAMKHRIYLLHMSLKKFKNH